MRTIVTVCFLLTFALSSISCRAEKSSSTEKDDKYYALEIGKLESADVTNDVAAAIQDSDYRFLVCVGFAGTIPGVPHWNEKLYKKYGTRILDGSGDIITCDKQLEYKKCALDYAGAYNKLLWSRTEGKK